MASLPVEILDMIMSLVQDDTATLHSCRLMSRLWSDVTRPFLRPSLSTAKDMDRFVELYRDSPANFRYRSVRFRYLDNEAVEAALRLLHACAESIKEVRIVAGFLSPDNFQKFLSALDSTVLPNLRSLSIERNSWSPCIPPQLSLPKLTTLRIPNVAHNNKIGDFAAALVDAAPNLKLFEAALTSGRQGKKAPVWPFPERFRALPTFSLKLEVTSNVNFTETLTEVLRKLQEWPNTRLSDVVFHNVARALMPELKGLMERILGHETANVKGLTLCANELDLDLGPGIDPPTLGALEALTVVGYGAALLVHPIPGDRFTALHSVTLRSYEEGTRLFRNSVFVSVTVLRLEGAYYKREEVAPGYFTPWAHVFPNLEAFVLVGGAHFGRVPEDLRDEYGSTIVERWLDLSLVQFLVTHLRMPSLRSVTYQLGQFYAAQRIFPEPNGLIGGVFSGLDNMDGVVEGAKEAQDVEKYWAQVEALRSPSLPNLHGLHTLYFDYPIDDAFATGVLLRMKPLEVLTICSKHLSKVVLEKVATHHKTLCFTPSEPKDEDDM